MSHVVVDLREMVSVCCDLAEKAGSIIQEVLQSGNLETVDKGVGDPCTRADTQAQDTIVGGLLSVWPELQIMAEENRPLKAVDGLTLNKKRLETAQVPSELTQLPLSDVTVVIDPLDATKEFTLGRYECVLVLIGISVRGKATAGIMFQPFAAGLSGKGQLFWGIVGGPLDGVVPAVRDEKKLILAVTGSRPTQETELAIARIKADEVLRVGGAGYKVLLIIERKADVWVMPTPGTSKWDTCAPEAILRAAGGTLTDMTGVALEYLVTSLRSNSNGVVASCGTDHSQILSKLAGKE